MPVPVYTLAGLQDAVHHVGVDTGDVLLVHASLLHLGRLDGVARAVVPARIIETLLALIGPGGTLVMPASSWEFATGTPFDLAHTPAAPDMGLLSAAFLRWPGIARSPNPTFNLIALGPRAGWICGGGNMHNMGFDSAWDRLFRTGARMLFLGAGLDALSFTRYMEMRYGVPYLYDKLFPFPVLDRGEPLHGSVVSLLRWLHLDVEYDLTRFERVLEDRGSLRSAPLGGGRVRAVTTSDCFDAGMDCLRQDIHCFLARPPRYEPGRPPLA